MTPLIRATIEWTERSTNREKRGSSESWVFDYDKPSELMDYARRVSHASLHDMALIMTCPLVQEQPR